MHYLTPLTVLCISVIVYTTLTTPLHQTWIRLDHLNPTQFSLSTQTSLLHCQNACGDLTWTYNLMNTTCACLSSNTPIVYMWKSWTKSKRTSFWTPTLRVYRESEVYTDDMSLRARRVLIDHDKGRRLDYKIFVQKALAKVRVLCC